MSGNPQSVAYKESGVQWLGKIPTHWKIKKIKYIFDETSIKNCGDKQQLTSTQQYGVIPKALYPFRTVEVVSSDLNAFKFVEKNNFVISLRSFEGGIEHSEYEGIISPAYTILKVKKSIEPLYFKFLLKSRPFISALQLYKTGIREGQNISYVELQQDFLPTPPLEEQKVIANFLDKKTRQIEEFITKKQKLITLLEEKKQTLINQCVTQGLDPSTPLKDSGVEWLGQIPTHWEVRKMKHLGKFQNGINIGAEAFGSGFPFVSYGDVYKNSSLPKTIQGLVESSEIDQKLYSVKEGDIFFTRTSETIEEIGMSSVCFQTIPNATFAGFLIRFRPSGNELDKGFSKFYFRSNLHRIFFIRENGLVTRASLSQELLKDLPVLLPPLEEQKAIAEYLDTQIEKIDLAISKIKSQINLIKEYKTTLISEAVCGRVGID